jgi:hypothetical protein
MQRRLRRLWGGVVGGILLIAAAVGVLLVQPNRARVRIQADARRLSTVGMVARLYAEDHGGAYPDTFATALHE